MDLADRFDGMLEFGTAGLRGALGGGPNRMNRAVVLRAAAGLVAYLQTELRHPGADGRGRVRRAVQLRRLRPRHRGRRRRRRVGAPRSCRDRCRRRCWPSRSGTSAPMRASWSRRATTRRRTTATRSTSATVARSCRRPTRRSPRTSPPSPRCGTCRSSTTAGRTSATRSRTPTSPGSRRCSRRGRRPTCSVVHTALHGVGDDTVRRVFAAAGFPPPTTVPSQAVPDPDFPTVSFPNPEEAGAIDAALAVAREVHPDVVIANDPDADRCAAAVLDQVSWRMLRGDELGALFFDASMRRGLAPDAVVACSIVSSRVLSALAASAGRRHEETLTGFKWIARVPGLGLRLRGGDRLLRRAGHRPRQGRRQRRPAPRLVHRGAQGRRAARSSTSSTTSPSTSACMRPTPSRYAWPTSRRSRRSWSGCGPRRRASSGR